MPEPISLRPVESIEIAVLIDNSVDYLLRDSERAKYIPVEPDLFSHEQLVAEHGYSAMVTVREGDRTRSLLYDSGLSRDGLSHNLDVLHIDPKDIELIVQSHGHADHHGGLEGLLRRLGRKGMPFLVHPDAWRMRKLVFPTGEEARLPPPDRQVLERHDLQVVENRESSLLLGDGVLLTGEVERVTEFETGTRGHLAWTGSGWEPDPVVADDQALVCHLKGKGLVIVTGCGHAGVVNVVRGARKATGVDRIHGLVGGMHLPSPAFDEVRPKVIDEIVSWHPDVVVPGHCTGYRTMQELGRRLPEAFVPTSVGARVKLG